MKVIQRPGVFKTVFIVMYQIAGTTYGWRSTQISPRFVEDISALTIDNTDPENDEVVWGELLLYSDKEAQEAGGDESPAPKFHTINVEGRLRKGLKTAILGKRLLNGLFENISTTKQYAHLVLRAKVDSCQSLDQLPGVPRQPGGSA